MSSQPMPQTPTPHRLAVNSSPPAHSMLRVIPTPFQGTQAPGTFVGATTDQRVAVGLVSFGSEVLVYLCDGDRLSDWFSGKVDGDQIDLTSRQGNRVSARLSRESIGGTLRMSGGETRRFAAVPAVEGQTGLYRTDMPTGGKNQVMGWILLPDGIRGAALINGKNLRAAFPGERALARPPDGRAYRPCHFYKFWTRALFDLLASHRAEMSDELIDELEADYFELMEEASFANCDEENTR